jgi:hypothetical protein
MQFPKGSKLMFKQSLDFLDSVKSELLNFIFALPQENQQREPQEENQRDFIKLQKLNFLL